LLYFTIILQIKGLKQRFYRENAEKVIIFSGDFLCLNFLLFSDEKIFSGGFSLLNPKKNCKKHHQMLCFFMDVRKL